MNENQPAIVLEDEATVYLGSCLDVLPTLDDNSIDAIVTDPPYELGFMGKKWDATGIAFNVEVWSQCLRVLKPGGHLLAFGGSRTWHRLAVAIEDAGFEIRDSIAWLYASGMPHSLDVAKAIEAKLTTGIGNKTAFRHLNGEQVPRGDWGYGDCVSEQGFRTTNYDHTAGPTRLARLEPTTDEAKQWMGWQTALKPAFEPIVVARKPIAGTIVDTVLTYGTGAFNIDATRLEASDLDGEELPETIERLHGETDDEYTNRVVSLTSLYKTKTLGRWPANVILDEAMAEELNDKTNDLTSRFFFVPKPSSRDRNEGLENLEAKVKPYGNREEVPEEGDPAGSVNARFTSTQRNFHPTVKPTDLMRYLVRLVTPPDGVVLDPFTGSGSTGKACLFEGFKFVGIELTEEYLPIIEGRLKVASKNGRLF